MANQLANAIKKYIAKRGPIAAPATYATAADGSLVRLDCSKPPRTRRLRPDQKQVIDLTPNEPTLLIRDCHSY